MELPATITAFAGRAYSGGEDDDEMNLDKMATLHGREL